MLALLVGHALLFHLLACLLALVLLALLVGHALALHLLACLLALVLLALLVGHALLFHLLACLFAPVFAAAIVIAALRALEAFRRFHPCRRRGFAAWRDHGLFARTVATVAGIFVLAALGRRLALPAFVAWVAVLGDGKGGQQGAQGQQRTQQGAGQRGGGRHAIHLSSPRARAIRALTCS